MGDWEEWKHLVLSEIKRANESHEELSESLRRIEKEVVLLKFQASMLGALAGAIPTILYLIVEKWMK